MRKSILLLASMAFAVLLASGVALSLPSEMPDPTLMVNGPVRTIEQVGTNLWVGGDFTQVQRRNGTVVANVSNVAVFNPNESGDLEYVDNITPRLGAGSTTSIVRDIAVYDADPADPSNPVAAVIGGNFPGPTTNQRNLVAVDGSTGQVLRWYNSGTLQSVLAAPDVGLGRIYGGSQYLWAFDFATGQKLWNRAQTHVDQSIHSHEPPAGYKDLELDPSTLSSAGLPTIWAACVCDDLSVSPSKAWALVKLDTEGNHDTSWVANVGSTDLMGISVAEHNDALYLGTGGSDWVARFSKADGSLLWKRDTSGSTQVVEIMDGQLVIGGHFVEVGDGLKLDPDGNDFDRCGARSSDPSTLEPFGDECQTRLGLASYSFGGTLEPSWDPALSGKYNLAWALYPEATPQGTRLHVGGEFTKVGGVTQTYYTRLPRDTAPPTVSSVVPAEGATAVAPEANAEASFSEAMDANTLNNTTFTLTEPDGTQVPATVGYDPSTNKATLNPNADLKSLSTYTATIKGGTEGVKDLAGNALGADKVWSFTTTLACTIRGTPNSETITGTAGNDVICAGGGNDTLRGEGGADTLKGEGGTDKLIGGVGNDTLDGGLGVDNADFIGSAASVSASLLNNSATGEGSDTLVGIENLFGSNQNDTFIGSDANNTLNGGSGDDIIDGRRGGADILKGAGNNDTLYSDDGESNDTVDGGGGTDSCTTDATESSVINCEG